MKKVKVEVLQWVIGLCVLLLATSVWGQQIPEAPRVTQAQACDHWSQPIQITIRQGDRLSVGRLGQIVYEDLPSSVATNMAQSRDFTAPRLVAVAAQNQSPHSTTVSGFVAVIYPDASAERRAALEAAVIAAISQAGKDRVSLEESYNYCPVANADGVVERVPARGRGFCDDARPVRRAHRTRLLHVSPDHPFRGDFYAGSFPIRDGHEDWHHLPGYSLRILLRTGGSRESVYTMNVNRVYGPEQHPRPGAQLCRLLTSLVDPSSTLPRNSNDRDNLNANILQLASIANAEGDKNVHDWALHEMKTLAPRIFDNAALGERERGEAQANKRTEHAVRLTVRSERAKGRSDARATRNKDIAIGAVALLILVSALEFFFFRKQAKRAIEVDHQELEAKLVERFEKGTKVGVTRLWESLGGVLQQLLDLATANLVDQHPGAMQLKTIAPHDLATHIHAAPSTFFTTLHEVFACALDGKLELLREQQSEERVRIRKALAAAQAKSDSLQSLLTPVTGLMESINDMCTGECTPFFVDLLTIEDIAKVRQIFYGIVIAVRKLVCAVSEDVDMSKPIGITEQEALKGGPLMGLVTEATSLVSFLREENATMAQRSKPMDAALTVSVPMLLEIHHILAGIPPSVMKGESLKQTILGVGIQIQYVHSRLATASQHLASSNGFTTIAPRSVTNGASSRDGGE